MGSVVHSYMDRNPNGGLWQAKGAKGFQGVGGREKLGIVEDSCLLAFGEKQCFSCFSQTLPVHTSHSWAD